MARKVYSLQFKQEAVAMTRRPDTSVRSVAKSLGVRPQTLEYWIEHPPTGTRPERALAAAAAAAAAEPADDPAALKLLLKEAQQRIRRLEMEKEILKKATAFFASQSP
jgi:transposase